MTTPVITQLHYHHAVDLSQAHEDMVRMLDGHPSRAPFRLDEAGGRMTMVSAVPPNVRRLGARVADARTKPYAPRVKGGEELLFQVRVWPGKRHNGRFLRALSQEEEPSFIERTLGNAGAHGVDVTFTWEPALRAVHHGRPITLVSADLAGRLRVTDATRFRQALLEGTGRHRTFGFGLILIQRTD